MLLAKMRLDQFAHAPMNWADLRGAIQKRYHCCPLCQLEHDTSIICHQMPFTIKSLKADPENFRRCVVSGTHQADAYF